MLDSFINAYSLIFSRGSVCLDITAIFFLYRKLVLYPEGISNYKGFCVSLFLEFADSSNCTSEHEVKAHVVLKIIDHYSNQSHIQKKGKTILYLHYFDPYFYNILIIL